MTQPSRFVVATTPNKEVPDGAEFRELDREELVQCIIAQGVQPVRWDGEPHRLIAIFVSDEVSSIIDKVLSNQEVPIEYKAHNAARALWRDAMTIWRDALRMNQVKIAKKL